MGLIFNDDPVVYGAPKSRWISTLILWTCVVLLLVGIFVPPEWLPYPKRWCAHHPQNTGCITYQPRR